MVLEIKGKWRINAVEQRVVLYPDSSPAQHLLSNESGVEAYVFFKRKKSEAETKLTLSAGNTVMLWASYVAMEGGNANSHGSHTAYIHYSS